MNKQADIIGFCIKTFNSFHNSKEIYSLMNAVDKGDSFNTSYAKEENNSEKMTLSNDKHIWRSYY